MDFYTIVIIIAVVLLILSLTAIGLIVTNANSTAKFPASYSSCPDYWRYNATDGTCSSINNINIGNPINGSYIYSLTPKKDVCENKRSIDRRNISWDGISNSNVVCT